jgi:hypothetical protein
MSSGVITVALRKRTFKELFGLALLVLNTTYDIGVLAENELLVII